MRIKKTVLFLTVLILTGLVTALALLIAFYDLEKPVKIRAKDVTTSAKKTEVQKLLNSAFAISSRQTSVLGAKVPLRVKKDGPKRTADYSFNAIALSWQERAPKGSKVSVKIRTSKDGNNWSKWKNVEIDEDGDEKDGVISDVIYGGLIVSEGKYFQERLTFETNSADKIPEVKNLKLTYIDSKEKDNLLEKVLKVIKIKAKEVFAATSVPKRPTDNPNVCSRSCWGADPSLMKWNPYKYPVKKAVIHHTVTANYDPNPKATIRAIYYYHAVTRGWGDIGYNFLVDSNGNIYEGRYGGDGVAGAHALGYNVGSVGVGVLGDFRYISPNKKVQNALHKIVVWKFYTHNVDPDKATKVGNPLKRLPSVFYHGQVSNTACAGTYLNNFTPSLKKLAHYMPQQIVLKDSSGINRIVGSSSQTVSSLLAAYKNKGVVAPNYIRKISAFPDDGVTPPNDTNYSSQWDLPKLEALKVWKESTGGSSSIKVAVVDTGVAYEDYNPSGSENYAKGPDFASTNFVAGYDYVNGDTHPNDDNGHGTVVASVIAESTNNSIGSASLAYDVSIMPVKVCDRDGWCLDSDVANGINFARTNGAKVVNMSIGGDDYSLVIQSMIDSAWNLGAVVVAASGNGGKNKVSYPGRGNHVIGVGALTSSNARASYSNYGVGLDLMAPGGNALGGSGDLLYQLVSCTASLDCTSFSYSRVAGTSFATPLVSASAALLVDQGTLWPDSVERFLELKAADLGSSGKDSVYGWGMVQPFDAFTLSDGEKPHPNGVLITTTKSGKVYLLDNGQKRWVKGRAIFEERFRWSRLVAVSSFELSTYPNGPDLDFSDGILIKGSSSNPVYVLSNGTKRWVTGRLIFEELDYKMDKVIRVPEAIVNSYPDGSDINSSGNHVDGTLIREESNAAVYLLDNGEKKSIPGRALFESRFFWDDVVSVTSSEFATYPTSPTLTFADGSLIKKAGDSKIYIISTDTGSSQQRKRWIIGSLTFNGLRFKWGNVQKAPDAVVNNFPDGNAVL